MAKNIALKIYIPEKIILDEKVYRVVLPCGGKTLTVIEDRAPTLMPLDVGLIKILGDENQVTDEYFVSGGAADIKENTCTILAEAVFKRAEIDLAKARELCTEFRNPFYEWLVKFFEDEEKFKKH